MGMGVADMTSTWGPAPPAALLNQGRLLANAEPVLLVGDHQPQAGKSTGSESSAWVPPPGFASPGPGPTHLPLSAAVMEPVSSATVTPLCPAGPEGLGMLLGQNLRGSHQGGLIPVLRHQPHTGRTHHRLSAAHVPLEQPVHRHPGSDPGLPPPPPAAGRR